MLSVCRVNANPMRDRAAKKTAPMTATATKMVKAIWASYFKPDEADAAAEDGGAGGVARLSWPVCQHCSQAACGRAMCLGAAGLLASHAAAAVHNTEQTGPGAAHGCHQAMLELDRAS